MEDELDMGQGVKADVSGLRESMESPFPDTQTRREDPWADRSKGMRCVSCMWWVQKAGEENEVGVKVGRCRRRSPTMGGFPVVFEIDWCGDHKLTLPVVPFPDEAL